MKYLALKKEIKAETFRCRRINKCLGIMKDALICKIKHFILDLLRI